jgi:hypothetical protein
MKDKDSFAKLLQLQSHMSSTAELVRSAIMFGSPYVHALCMVVNTWPNKYGSWGSEVLALCMAMWPFEFEDDEGIDLQAESGK